MSGDYEWSEKDVLLQEQSCTAVYENGKGEIVILQHDGLEGDNIVIVNRMYLRRLIDRLIRLDEDGGGHGTV